MARRSTDTRLGLPRFLPKPGPMLYTSLALYCLGLFAVFAAPPLFYPSQDEIENYQQLMAEAQFSNSMKTARQALIHAQHDLDQVHVFGWRWRQPYNVLVPKAQERLAVARDDFLAETRERDALVSEAKQSVGLWSEYGLTDARDAFWSDYQWGKDFAKRMTFWDFIFATRGRDEELVLTLLRWLGQILMVRASTLL